MSVLYGLAKEIAYRDPCSFGAAKTQIQQRISYAICSTVATSILVRMPAHAAETVLWKT